MIDHELLLNYCLGKCTQEEQIKIEKALSASEELRNELHNLQLSLSIANDIKEMEAIDIEVAYQRTQKKIRKERNRLFQRQCMRYAAFLSLPLLISTLVLYYLNFSAPEVVVQYAEIKTPMGTITRYELPDKSVVWLNGGTKLRHPVTFSKNERTVSLDGEAYFDVQADPKNPFYVNMPHGLSVYVYGTQFNINAYAEESYIETVLEKGKINVITPDQKSIVLLPGEHLFYERLDHKSIKNKVDVYEKVAWKDGKLIFRDTSLEEIFKRLERHFNVEIEFNNKYNKEYKYRATFRNETLAQILDYLSKSAALKWKTQDSEQQADDTFTKKKIIIDLN